MHPLTAGVSAVCTMLAAGVLAAWGAPRVIVVHLVFAAGIVPLIFAAMLHFVPVLTRTGTPSRLLMAVPAVALGVGWSLVLTLAGWWTAVGIPTHALVDFLLAATLLAWILVRVRKTVGTPHPGLRWYLASLALLAVALLAISAIAVLPEAFRTFRTLHLHLNVLGFIGMAAFGTLPVLLPTTLGLRDPAVANWLTRASVRFAVACLLAACSAALGVARIETVATGFGIAGFLLLSAIVLSLTRHWFANLKVASHLQSGAGMSLIAATFGFQAVLVLGVLHGIGALGADATVPAFMGLFLLPLVSGALTHLLPVWRFPGPETQRRLNMAATMGRFALTRIVCFQGSGVLFAGGVDGLALAAVGAGIALFVMATVNSLTESRVAGG